MCVIYTYVDICIIIMFLFFFFFKAEDGIQDLVRSRGQGNVYKGKHGGRIEEHFLVGKITLNLKKKKKKKKNTPRHGLIQLHGDPAPTQHNKNTNT